MSSWNRFIGIFGAVILGFGLLGMWAVGGFSDLEVFVQFPLLYVHIAAGLLSLLYWFVTIGLKNINQTGDVLLGRTARFGYNAFFASVVYVGILVVANYFAGEYDRRWDLTENGVYSLAGQTKSILEKLNKPLKIVILKGLEGQNEFEVKQRLELYQGANPSKVALEVLDPKAKPHLVDKYGFKPGNLVYIEYGEGEKKGVSRINEVTEDAVTNAILKLQRGEAKKIYYVEGHGEPAREGGRPESVSKLMAAIADEHLTVAPILLSQSASVPEDAAAVLLVSPKKDLLPEERDVLIKYVDQGGHLVMLTDPRTTGDVKTIASHFDIKVGDDVVIDQVQRLFAAPALGAQPVARTYAPHAMTKDFGSAQVTIYNIASTVSAPEKPAANVTYTELVKTGPTSWAESNLAALLDSEEPTATLDNDDKVGPVSLAVAYEKKIPNNDAAKKEVAAPGEADKAEKMSRVVVVGDSDWVLNANIQVYSNRDLVLNAINWVAGEEAGLSIRPATMRESSQPISEHTFMLILASSLVVPELLLLAGLLIWWRRKTAFA